MHNFVVVVEYYYSYVFNQSQTSLFFFNFFSFTLISYKGWSQFVKAAKSMDGTVILLQKSGIPMDFYLYCNNSGNPYSELVPGIQFDTIDLDAVACVPKHVQLDTDLQGRKWTKAAKKVGAVATFNSLCHNTGATATTAGSGGKKEQVPSITSNPTDEADYPRRQEEDQVVASSSLQPVNSSNIAPPAPITTSHISPELEDDGIVASPGDGDAVGTDMYPSALAAPSPSGGACYLGTFVCLF